MNEPVLTTPRVEAEAMVLFTLDDLATRWRCPVTIRCRAS